MKSYSIGVCTAPQFYGEGKDMSAAMKMLVLPQLGVVLLFGTMAAFAYQSDSNAFFFILAAAAIVIPFSAFLSGRRMLYRILGADPGWVAALSGTVSSGRAPAPAGHVAAESVAGAFMTLSSRLEKVSGELSGSVMKVNSGVEQLSAEANEILFNSQMQAAAVNDAKAVMGQMSERIHNVSDLTRDTEALSRHATDLSANGESVVQDAVQEMRLIAEVMTRASDQINALTSHAREISNVATVIKEIANQTNLLALNAAIEAARAGEHGRGFAAVADEVRALSERTMHATKEIDETIKVMQNQTMDAVEGIGRAMPLVIEGVDKANRAVEVLRRIREESGNTLEKISQLAMEIEEQTHLANNVVESVSQVLDMAANTDSIAERAMQTAVGLSHAAMELEGLTKGKSI